MFRLICSRSNPPSSVQSNECSVNRRNTFVSHIILAASSIVFVVLLILGLPGRAQTTTPTLCSQDINGTDITINKGLPHDAFIASGANIVHVASVSPGNGPCKSGARLPNIPLGFGMSSSWGVALDRSGNLYVTAGANIGNITKILVIAPPYTGAPIVYYSGGINFRSLAIHHHTLYAADTGAGTVLRFDLSVGATSVTTFAHIPTAFGIFAADLDDLFVTSNSMGQVFHATPTGTSVVVSGMSFPEGISGDEDDIGTLYIATGGVIFKAPATGGSPSFYAGSPILFSHGITVWEGAGYLTDSQSHGHIYKFPVLYFDAALYQCF